jgi:acyl carrier protein
MATDTNRREIMSLDEFTEWFVSAMEWSPPEISEEHELVNDLGMDSVGAVDLIVGLEDAVGGDVVMPIDMILQIVTVRDAYLQYCELAHLPHDKGTRS